MSMINVNGVSLNYSELGSRNSPTILFSHLLGPWRDVTGRFEVVRAVFNREDISEAIRTIKAPTLVIAGMDDPSAPPAEARVMASRIPNAELKIIDDASHMVVIEKPQQVAQAIQDFLRGSCIRKTS